MSTKLTPLQLAIIQAMQGKAQPQRNALSDLFSPPRPKNALADLLSKPTQPATNGLGMFGNLYPPSLSRLPGALSLLGGLTPKTRHVFYSFHYDDVHRVNHVRLKDQFRATDKQSPRVVDRSMWERTKVTNPARLSQLIDDALEGTSTTCVLAGFATWDREWVRYEIARSLQRGNGLLTVYIHNCKHPQFGAAPRGPNPLDFIALGSDLYIYELDRLGRWKPFGRVSEKLTAWPKWLRQPRFAEYFVPLSQGARSYDWIIDDGVRNLIHWTDAAAAAAGK